MVKKGKVKKEERKPIIEVRKIKKTYLLGETKVHALRGVSLNVYPGELIIILGPSGSGKSTLLHQMGALDIPTEGKVLVDGLDITQMDSWNLSMLRRKKMGFIFQSFNLIPTLDAVENVHIPLLPTNVSEVAAHRRAMHLLKEVGIEDRAHHKPNQLSGGERQRVSIARALINDPEIIFADEPTGNLDSKTGEKVLEIIRKLNEEEGKTFVIVTHDASLVEFADRVFIIRDGLIEEENLGGKNGHAYKSESVELNKRKRKK
ncbi:MAG: ABC transporter ATP-binding protein [Candidatus Diapherotrites archaeon]|nr:ABC transporter ATP-binding protein [Candidatus Diapherotrites archaeon]